MNDRFAHDIERFLSELSEEAKAYYLPGVGEETHTGFDSMYLCKQAPLSMPCHDYPRGRDGRNLIDEQELSEDWLNDGEIYDYQPRKAYSVPRKRMARLDTGSLFSFRIPKQETLDAEPPVADLEPDNRTKRIMEEFDALVRKNEMDIEEVYLILELLVKLSHLHITSKNEILLVDYGDKKEVKMDPLTKAVYFLYLKHPEGIRYKELSDHQRELEEIYSSITGRENLDSIRKSVADLCDPLNNSINEKVSKVKKAFLDVVNGHVARFYYIDGKKGTAKGIALDRDYVLWE